MEDVLDVSVRPDDARFPPVCMDEPRTHLVGEPRVPIPTAPGRPRRGAYAYARRGVSNLLLVVERRGGWRHVRVTHRRTNTDWAHAITDLVDAHYPAAEPIVRVMDNRTTHGFGSLDAACSPDEARRLSRRREIHDTPTHGRWRTIAEIEVRVLRRHWLDRRIPHHDHLAQVVARWTNDRTTLHRTIDGRCTTADARIKLQRLSPSF